MDQFQLILLAEYKVNNMIKLKGGAEVEETSDTTACKACGALMTWAITKNNKKIPIVKEGDEWISHFANCSNASSFRKKV